MHVVDDANGLGTAASDGSLTVLLWPDTAETTFSLHDDDDMVTTIAANAGGVTVSRALKTTLLRIWTGSAPASVAVNSTAATAHADRAAFDAATEGWFYEAGARSIWVKLGTSTDAQSVAF